MSRIKRLLKPEAQASNWKAALPAVALVLAACAVQFQQPAHADVPAQAGSEHPVLDFATCAKPKYPAESLQQKHTGTVTIAFDVTAQGKVTASRISKSSGHTLLDEAARVAIEKCSFKPAYKNGKPENATALVQYVWALK